MLIKYQLTSKHLMCFKDIKYISFPFSQTCIRPGHGSTPCFCRHMDLPQSRDIAWCFPASTRLLGWRCRSGAGRAWAPMLWAPGPNGEVITEVWGWRGHPRSHPWVMKSPGGAQGTAGDTRAAEGSADLVHVLARVLSAMAGASALGTQGKKIRACSGNSIRRMFVHP